MRIVFVGASGHGKVCAETARLAGYDEILFLDDNKELDSCGRYPVVGTGDDFGRFVDENTEFFVSIGDGKIRGRMQEKIKSNGGRMAVLIHPESIVSEDVVVGSGSVIMAGAVVNSGTMAGEGIIVNTSSTIDHDCVVDAYSHIAVGARLCGGVNIGSKSWVGAGAVINNNLTICSGCMIGSGAVVVKDIDKPGIYIGVPVRKKD